MNTKNVIDISVLTDKALAVWPGSPGFSSEFLADKAKGDFATNSMIRLDVHLGTHIDAPLHHIPGGKSINEIEIEKCLGLCSVLDFRGNKRITQEDLEKKFSEAPTLFNKRILLKTDNSEYQLENPSTFNKDYTALDISGALFIASKGIHLVGIDYYSIQKFEDPPDVHEILLHKEVIILETINLSSVDEGEYYLSCLPVKISGIEGAPCRAILVEL